jgi:hypothetical protein
MQVFVGFDCGCMITVLPKRPVPILPLVVFLRRSTGDELHALSDSIFPGILHQEVDVIGCHHVVEHAQTQAFLSCEHPVQIAALVPRSEIQTSNIER